MRNATEIAADIRALDIWNPDLCAELCEAAGMIEEWEDADDDAFEQVVLEAAEKLGVEVL